MSTEREAVRECAAYFRENPAFARIMEALRRKYESYGNLAGTVVIKDASAAECEAARGIFGTPFSAPLKFKAAQFENALQTTKFQGVSLKDVLESYFGAEIKTRRERDVEAERRYRRMLRETRTDGETSRRWLDALERINDGAPCPKTRRRRVWRCNAPVKVWTGWSVTTARLSGLRFSVQRRFPTRTRLTAGRCAGICSYIFSVSGAATCPRFA